jgi:hypothetical protein
MSGMLKKNRIKKSKCSFVLFVDRSLESCFSSSRYPVGWIICGSLALPVFLGIIAAIITPFILFNQQNASSTTSLITNQSPLGTTQTTGNTSLNANITTIVTSCK